MYVCRSLLILFHTGDRGLREKCGGVSAGSSRTGSSAQTRRGAGTVELRDLEDSPDNPERGVCVCMCVYVKYRFMYIRMSYYPIQKTMESGRSVVVCLVVLRAPGALEVVHLCRPAESDLQVQLNCNTLRTLQTNQKGVCVCVCVCVCVLTISTSKSKILAVLPNNGHYQQPRDVLLRSGDELVSKVEDFEYLGSIITSDCSLDKEISSRISKASRVFNSLYKVLWLQKGVKSRTKLRMFKSVILSTLLYGSETWAPMATQEVTRFCHEVC